MDRAQRWEEEGGNGGTPLALRFQTNPRLLQPPPLISVSCTERERLLKLEIERYGLETQMLADETEAVDGAAAAATREVDQVCGPRPRRRHGTAPSPYFIFSGGRVYTQPHPPTPPSPAHSATSHDRSHACSIAHACPHPSPLPPWLSFPQIRADAAPSVAGNDARLLHLQARAHPPVHPPRPSFTPPSFTPPVPRGALADGARRHGGGARGREAPQKSRH
eukprot:scaffold21834_cov123-Isochrysis_galbana.AAC.6